MNGTLMNSQLRRQLSRGFIHSELCDGDELPLGPAVGLCREPIHFHLQGWNASPRLAATTALSPMEVTRNPRLPSRMTSDQYDCFLQCRIER